VLTYPFRAADDLVWVLGVQRYHLFPLAGIAMILAAGWRRMSEYCPRFRGVERRVAAVAAIALLMFVIQRPGIKQHARFFDYREQDRTFAAIDRLAERARAAGMSRPDILSKLDPIRPVWAPDPDIFNSLELMQAWEVDGPNHRLTSREEILALLSPDEVEALCVGLDVGGRIRPASSTKLDRSSELVPIETSGSRIRALRVEGRYQTTGELAFLESIWERNSGAPRTLAARLPKRGELWWPDEEGRWSPLRSVSWDRTELNETSLIDLDGIPHWRWTGRMRLVIRGKEQTEIEQPRIFR
jgi:hypothetical protein